MFVGSAAAKPAHGSPARVGSLVLGPSTQKMPHCSIASHQPPISQIALVVRVVIGPNFDPSKPVRNVRYKDPGANEDADDENENGMPNSYPDDPGAPFSIDFRNIVNSNGKYAAIRVILKDDHYNFYDHDGLTGVGFADITNKLKLCGAHIVPKSHPAAVFYLKMKAASNPRKTVKGAYGIGLEPKNSPSTPIFVDPEVENNG